MSTFIHGIAASENLDSSGEIVSIAGMDTSSLAKDGTINWAHLDKSPSQTVGKIVYEKKILDLSYCENEYQKYFWNKCQTPYLYIIGELFDAQGHQSARDLAAILKYDAENRDRHQNNTVSFSVEGVTLSKKGNIVTRSIARKVTCDTLPCNKVAIAEIVMPTTKESEDELSPIFKTEVISTIELLENASVGKETLSKSEDDHIGQTKSGKKVSSSARIHEYKNFSEQDHRDAAAVHLDRASSLGTTNAKQSKIHRNKGLLHIGAANTLLGRGAKLKKALEAGQGNAAPSQLSGGAALAKEDLSSKTVSTSSNASRPNTGYGKIIHTGNKQPSGYGKVIRTPSSTKMPSYGKVIMKSQALSIAEEEYGKWNLKPLFEEFMHKKMPNLTKSEIEAIGQTIVLDRQMTLEEALTTLSGVKISEQASELSQAKAGTGDVFVMLLFEGCSITSILHCSLFATEIEDDETYLKIDKVCEDYVSENASSRLSKTLTFAEEGKLGKKEQRVLFLTDGDPFSDLFEKLSQVAKYKYDSFRPHVSVTHNIDSFSGTVSAIAISVDGQERKRYILK